MLFVIIYVMIIGTDAARILMVPANVKSHILYFVRLGEGMAALGDQVELIHPANTAVSSLEPRGNFSISPYPVKAASPYVNSKEASELILASALSKSAWKKFNFIHEFLSRLNEKLNNDCVSLLDNSPMMERLKKTVSHFVILDPLLGEDCYHLVPKILNIPYGYLSVNFQPTGAFRVPRLPSFVPTFGAAMTDEMTFSQRSTSLVLELLANWKFWMSDSPNNFARKYFQNSTSYHTIWHGASVWLYLEDTVLGFPQPNMPNTISVGDNMAGQPIKPLPKNLEQFLGRASAGTLLVSFGSFFDYVPEFLANGFCDAFRRLKYQVIWKLKNDSYCKDVENVMIVKWIPQNDLLADERVRLFITHGGLNSLVESIYHAKPVIVFPFALDNTAAVSAKGYGLRMEISEFNVEDLLKNIETILTDPGYVARTKKASAIMKDKQNTPAQRAGFLINHVIKHGDGHLRTGAFKLSLIQFLMIDVFIVTTLGAIFLLAIAFTCFRSGIKLTGKIFYSIQEVIRSRKPKQN